EYDQSSAVYGFLAFIDPSEPVYWMGMGNSEYFCQRFDKALKAYEVVAELDPDNLHCHFYSSHCHQELNHIDDAIESVEKANEVIKRNPGLKEWQEQANVLKAYFNEIKAR